MVEDSMEEVVPESPLRDDKMVFHHQRGALQLSRIARRLEVLVAL